MIPVILIDHDAQLRMARLTNYLYIIFCWVGLTSYCALSTEFHWLSFVIPLAFPVAGIYISNLPFLRHRRRLALQNSFDKKYIAYTFYMSSCSYEKLLEQLEQWAFTFLPVEPLILKKDECYTLYLKEELGFKKPFSREQLLNTKEQLN